MQSGHTARHTRRGFFRGDAAPKFFPLVESAQSDPTQAARQAAGQAPLQRTNAVPALAAPVAAPTASTAQAPVVPFAQIMAGVYQQTPPAAVQSVTIVPADKALQRSAMPAAFSSPRQAAPAPPRTACDEDEFDLDFRPSPSHLLHNLDGTLSSARGHAFLSWLADQLSGQGCDVSNGENETSGEGSDQDFDPHLDSQLVDGQLPAGEHDEFSVDLSYELEASYTPEEEAPELPYLSLQVVRGKTHPRVETAADGGRIERFSAGSKVIKDVLGRVVEVQSRHGDCLYLRYGVFGKLEAFQRTDAEGTTHSEGKRDQHGVVVRDHEGRARAAGESMTVDPRGCFYVHTIDGQYFSLDLVAGIHSERRRVQDERGAARFVTSLFAYDGFRMATMFGPLMKSSGTAHGGMRAARFRFYGRDGTMIDFASDQDLAELMPALVSPPASRKVQGDWLCHRQAATAWESVHEYLMRVS